MLFTKLVFVALSTSWYEHDHKPNDKKDISYTVGAFGLRASMILKSFGNG